MSNRHIRRRGLLAATAFVLSLFTGACLTASDSGGPSSAGAQSALTPQAEASPRAVGTPGPSAAAAAVASPSAVPAAVEVSPPAVTVGAVTLNLALDQPRYMVDRTAVAPTDPAQSAAQDPARVIGQGAVVLSDMVRVSNNMDPTQPAPADSAQSIVRHVVLQVRSPDSGPAVPYLDVSMDVLLDGHPVAFGQAVVPMVALGADSPRLYYGNNLRLPQRGTYQIFVRMARSPMLGKDAPPAAQFNLSVR